MFFKKKNKEKEKEKDDGYESDEEEVDFDEEEQENEKLRIMNTSKHPYRFYGLNARTWYCDECQKKIDTNDKHYHCFECADYDLCASCYEKGKSHRHGKENFFYELDRPNWYYTNIILDQKDNTCCSVMLETFQNFRNRHFLGLRPDIKTPEYSWIYYGGIEAAMYDLVGGMNTVLKLKRGDFVSILCDIKVEPIVVWFACMYLGIAFVPLQGILPPSEKKYILEQADVKCVFCLRENVEELLELAKEVKSIKQVVVIGSGDQPLDAFSNENGIEVSHFDVVCAKGHQVNPVVAPDKSAPDDIRCIIYTSGTTGFPKGIVFREKGWLIEMTRLSYTVPLVIFSFLPYSHISGMSDILVAFFNGGRCGMLTGGDMNNLFEDFKLLRPTILSTIPRVLNFVYAEFQRQRKVKGVGKATKDMEHIFGDRVLEITVGSAHCSNKVKSLIRKVCKIPVFDGYGISEVGTVSYNYRVPTGVDIKLVDCPELGYSSKDKPYPRGEICVKNKLTETLEYYKNEEVTKRKFDKDGYFHSGDIVEMRGNRIILIDRKNNILKLAQGEFVSLENAEKVLETSEFVDQLVLTANPSKSKLVGVVSVNPSMKKKFEEKEFTEKDIMNDFRRIGQKNKLNNWELPSFIYLSMEKFPLTELKKKKRRVILEKYKTELKKLYKKSSNETFSDIESFISNLLASDDSSSFEQGKLQNRTFKELGGDSFTGVTLINEFKLKGIDITYTQLMKEPLSKILSLIKDSDLNNKKEEEKEEERVVNLKKEKEKFAKFVQEKKIPYTVDEKKHQGGRKTYEMTNEMKKKFQQIVKNNPKHIFLTGVTGFLGKMLLIDLIINFPKTNISCLIRTENEHTKSFLKNSRIKMIVGDLSKHHLGLTDQRFNELKNSVDMIVHCGAMVNHFASYADHYDVNVRSIYDCAELCEGYKPFVYISTLSVFRTFPMKYGSSLDDDVPDFDNGYPASKWMADCLVRSFFSGRNLVIRPTFLIGDTHSGECNRKDWVCRLLLAMMDVGCVPIKDQFGGDMDIPFDMLSVDFLSGSVMNMMKTLKLYETEKENGFNFSFENISFKQMMIFLMKNYPQLKGVSWEEWVKSVEKLLSENNRHPFIPFFKNFKKVGRLGDSSFVPVDSSNFKKYQKNWRKMTEKDLKKFISFLRAPNNS